MVIRNLTHTARMSNIALFTSLGLSFLPAGDEPRPLGQPSSSGQDFVGKKQAKCNDKHRTKRGGKKEKQKQSNAHTSRNVSATQSRSLVFVFDSSLLGGVRLVSAEVCVGRGSTRMKEVCARRQSGFANRDR